MRGYYYSEAGGTDPFLSFILPPGAVPGSGRGRSVGDTKRTLVLGLLRKLYQEEKLIYSLSGYAYRRDRLTSVE